MLHYQKSFKASIETIKLMQKELERKLHHLEPRIRDSIEMAAWELLENGVKYHVRHDLKANLEFEVEVRDRIRIVMANQVATAGDTAEVTEIIHRINRSPDIQTLYVKRLGEIMDHRVRGQSKLGLLKVACEGGFSLSYRMQADRLQIIAEKDYQTKERELMSPLHYEDLKIDIIEDKLVTSIIWRGRSRSLNPEKTLDRYLEELQPGLVGRKVIVDFTELEAMNSSTVPPLLTFIRELETRNIPAFVIFNDSEHWQKASFIPLTVLTDKFKFVKIKGASLAARPFSSLFGK